MITVRENSQRDETFLEFVFVGGRKTSLSVSLTLNLFLSLSRKKCLFSINMIIFSSFDEEEEEEESCGCT